MAKDAPSPRFASRAPRRSRCDAKFFHHRLLTAAPGEPRQSGRSWPRTSLQAMFHVEHHICQDPAGSVVEAPSRPRWDRPRRTPQPPPGLSCHPLATACQLPNVPRGTPRERAAQGRRIVGAEYATSGRGGRPITNPCRPGGGRLCRTSPAEKGPGRGGRALTLGRRKAAQRRTELFDLSRLCSVDCSGRCSTCGPGRRGESRRLRGDEPFG